MTVQLLQGFAGGSGSPVHAVPAGTLDALCGTTVTTVTGVPFPGSPPALCRACSRENAHAGSIIPLRTRGEKKRAGGM